MPCRRPRYCREPIHQTRDYALLRRGRGENRRGLSGLRQGVCRRDCAIHARRREGALRSSLRVCTVCGQHRGAQESRFARRGAAAVGLRRTRVPHRCRRTLHSLLRVAETPHCRARSCRLLPFSPQRAVCRPAIVLSARVPVCLPFTHRGLRHSSARGAHQRRAGGGLHRLVS